MNLVELKSVGSVIDIDDSVVFPMMENGEVDLSMDTPLVEVSDEWCFSLSEKDRTKLEKLNLLERF